jgi:hypothetical protein
VSLQHYSYLPNTGNARKRRQQKNEFPEAISPGSIEESRNFDGQSDKMDQTNNTNPESTKFDRPKYRIAHSMKFSHLQSLNFVTLINFVGYQ